MADATQDLMLRVRGDNSGVDKAMAGTTRSVERLGVTAQKARGAFKSFSRDLAQARDASDIASSAAGSLSMVLGRTLPGAIAIGAIGIFTDQIIKMKGAVDEAREKTKLATDNIKKLGEAANLSDAIAQTGELDSNIKSLNAQLSKIESSPFQKLIAGMMGAKKEMSELVKASQKLRDSKLAEGITSENANDELMNGLDAESKKLYEIDAQYRKRSKMAESITSPKESQAFKRESGEIMARQRNAILDKQAKDRADKEAAYQKELFQAEMAASKFERETKEKADKEIADQRKANEEAAHKEAIFNIEEEARLEANAEKTKFQRQISNARQALEQQKRAQKTATDVSGGLLGASQGGRQALDVARKQRERQLKTEDFKTQEQFFAQMTEKENKAREAKGLPAVTEQRMREKFAAQQVAGEMPSLGERIQGGLSGVDPSQLAMQAAASNFEKDRMIGVPGRALAGAKSPDAKLGQEQSTLSKETLQAIQSLVDLMKSGTVVK
jgi:hypothetical protein